MCGQECIFGSVKCTTCTNWTHYKCANIPTRDLKRLESRDSCYHCAACVLDDQSVFDFNKSLSRIHASLYNPVQMTKICKNEHALLDIYGITIPVINDDQKIGQIDTAATSILKKYHPIVLQNNSARRVYGDGNCLYRAVSSALFGSESQHLLLRLLTTIEIACHRHIYDITDHQCILNDNGVVSSTYHDLLMSTVKPGQYAEMLHVYALSAALNQPIQSYYPPLSLTDMTSFCTYLRNKLAPVLLQHVVRPKNNHNITRNWTNNNAESANHILKHAVDWKPQHLPALIETLQKTVQLQYTDLNRALTSRGEFRLHLKYKRYAISPNVWATKTTVQTRQSCGIVQWPFYRAVVAICREETRTTSSPPTRAHSNQG